MQHIKHLRAAALAVAIIVSSIAAPFSIHADTVSDAGNKAADWLATKIEADGGFGTGFSKGSDIGATADAILALTAAGKTVTSVKSKAGKSPLDFFAQQLRLRKAISTGQYAKMALAVKSANLDPRSFNRTDLVQGVRSGYDDATGVIGDSVFVHCLGMLALARAGEAVPDKALTKLESLQTKAGGWAFAGDDKADVDTTALCAQALIASGRDAKSSAVARAMGYLRSIQNADGGFPYQSPSQFGTDSNANSTALVAQAIIASGDQPESWAAVKGNPLSALLVLQQPSGAIAYQAAMPDENVLGTAGAIPALYRKTFGS
jgi:prenyltransferase beta subunit